MIESVGEIDPYLRPVEKGPTRGGDLIVRAVFTFRSRYRLVGEFSPGSQSLRAPKLWGKFTPRSAIFGTIGIVKLTLSGCGGNSFRCPSRDATGSLWRWHRLPRAVGESSSRFLGFGIPWIIGFMGRTLAWFRKPVVNKNRLFCLSSPFERSETISCSHRSKILLKDLRQLNT